MTISFGASNPMKDTGDYIDPADFNKVLAACSNGTERLFLKVLWNTGRRISEIIGGKLFRVDLKTGEKFYYTCPGLRPKDIDYEHGKIHFWIIKKKEPYRSPKDVDAAMLEDLKKYIETCNIGPDVRIFPFSRTWGYLILRKASIGSGVRTFSGRLIHPHAFRHSWNVRASRILGTPEDLVLQRDIMEHSNIQITMSYLKYADGRAKKLVEKMGTETEDVNKT